jgi:Domain of unknown function (DUF4226)
VSDEQITEPAAAPPLPHGLANPNNDDDRRRPPTQPILPRLPGSSGPQQQPATQNAPTQPQGPQPLSSNNPASPAPNPNPGLQPQQPSTPSSPAAASAAAPAGGNAGSGGASAAGPTSTPAEDAAQQAKPAAMDPGKAVNMATGMISPAVQAAMGIPTALMGLGSGLLAPFSQILQQFGQGNPAMPSSSGVPPGVLDRLGSTDASTGVTGDIGDAYQSDVNAQTNQAHALDHLEKNLRSTLEKSAANSTTGRDKIEQIINQVKSNLQALGPIANSPAGQLGVLTAITQGLQQAGSALLQAVGQDGLNAQTVKKMSLDYLKDLHGGGSQDAELTGNFGPTGRLTPNSSPHEVFAAVLAEAKRRGYSLDKALACASTMWQESKGRVNAQDPSGQWYGPFQQDRGYAGRRDPNLNIAAFFDRLDAKGGRTAPDIWKTIFWLQQAPGMGSAEAAYASGRRAYLAEIQSQLPVVTQMYRAMSGGSSYV